jgi:flagellar biosynthetic protein FlhB
MGSRMTSDLSHLGDRPLAEVNTAALGILVMNDVAVVAMVTGPLLLLAAFVAVAGNVMQTGWVFSSEKLKLDFARLNPAQGFSRLMPATSWVDLIKIIVSVTPIAYVAVRIVNEIVADSPRLIWMAPTAAAITGWQHMVTLLWRSGLALFALAGADYGLQFYRQRSSLKMSKQEQKDESKASEGNPEIKQRVRRVQREINKRRMMSAVKNATVVVTNPTHYAVALEYRRETMAAPVIVAKGKDLMAQKIKAIARESGVPIVESVALAQALFKGAEIGDSIPGPLFGAVAEILAYLVRIKQLML